MNDRTPSSAIPRREVTIAAQGGGGISGRTWAPSDAVVQDDQRAFAGQKAAIQRRHRVGLVRQPGPRLEAVDHPLHRRRRLQRLIRGAAHVDHQLAVRITLDQAMGDMDRQRRLADPAHAADRGDRRRRAVPRQQRLQLGRLPLATRKVPKVCGQLAATRWQDPFGDPINHLWVGGLHNLDDIRNKIRVSGYDFGPSDVAAHRHAAIPGLLDPGRLRDLVGRSILRLHLQANARRSLYAYLDATAKSPDHRQYDDGEDNESDDRRVHHCLRFLVITLEPRQRGARMVDIRRLDTEVIRRGSLDQQATRSRPVVQCRRRMDAPH
ncbi:MAG: hypothetical protein IIA73_07465 [Proteobacteria bacterium]|nr:hypothetical protein [Pseudomonadota bacterium]